MSKSARVDAPEELSLEAVKEAHIDRVLQSVGGNQARAAKILRIGRTTLHRLLKARALKSPVGGT